MDEGSPEPAYGQARSPDGEQENDMLKGGLLWLIGIPLPIILILWFLGFLS